jgi:hypothetical protein
MIVPFSSSKAKALSSFAESRPCVIVNITMLNADMPGHCLSKAARAVTSCANQPNCNPAFASFPLALVGGGGQLISIIWLLTGAYATQGSAGV